MVRYNLLRLALPLLLANAGLLTPVCAFTTPGSHERSARSALAKEHGKISASHAPIPIYKSRTSDQSDNHSSKWSSSSSLGMSTTTDASTEPMGSIDTRPQVFSTGYSTNPNLVDAIEEATLAALSSLPRGDGGMGGMNGMGGISGMGEIDLGFVMASSLYEEPSKIVPTICEVIQSSSSKYGYQSIRNIVGSTAGGIIGSKSSETAQCQPVESEGTPAISITLALLPDVQVQTFHLTGEDVPEDGGYVGYDSGGMGREGRRMSRERWLESVGLGGFGVENGSDGSGGSDGSDGSGVEGETNLEEKDDAIFFVIPSPAFQNNLDDFLEGLSYNFPHGQTFGGIASTVSSLSRARIFCYSSDNTTGSRNVYGDGCVGVALRGDIAVDTMIAQGAKPVGGVYRVVATGAGGAGGAGGPGLGRRPMGGGMGGMGSGMGSSSGPGRTSEEDASRSTIGAIVLDEAATAEEDALEEEEENANDANTENADEQAAKRARLAQEYAKARIPKPPLAEANFIMRRLSDDDQAFMRRALLIGLERGGSIGRTPNELMRLAKGEGHRFTVRQVASAGMKDGSVTFPLGSVEVEVGTRCRFFVRDGDFAKKEVEALWTGFKKRELEGTLMWSDSESGGSKNSATGCMVFPTLDRGSKLFGGKAGYEIGVVSSYLPSVASISGFFANGVLGKLDGTIGSSLAGSNENMLHGSASCYVIFRSKTKRPFYSPQQAKLEAANAAAAQAEADAAERELAIEDEKRSILNTFASQDPIVSPNSSSSTPRAPRSTSPSTLNELIVRRREIHSGRSLSVSTVEWSVAEKMAKPTSALEGYMWEKETVVDRQRERIPLALLMSQCKAAMKDLSKFQPRDWVGSLRRTAEGGRFVIVPECKRMEPTTGSLRKRYDLSKLVQQFTSANVPSISVNSDGVLFGGSLEDITKAREASQSAAISSSMASLGDFEGVGAMDDMEGVITPPILASDLLLYPYQLYKLRLAGADAVTLVTGALQDKDLLYLTKIAGTLQLQVVASVTTEVQIERICNTLGKSGGLAALVVSNRDLETFDFDHSGEQALRLLRSDALAKFRDTFGEDVPILVEGRVGMIDAEGSGDFSNYIQSLKEAGASGAIVAGGIATLKEEDVANALESWSI